MNEILQSLTETSPILLILFKVTLLLGLAWGLHFGLARANPRWRVLLWRGTMIGLLFIPVAEFLSPKIPVPIEPSPLETTTIKAQSPQTYFNQSHAPIAPMSTLSTKFALSTTPPPSPQPKPIQWRDHLQEIALGLWGLIAIGFVVRRLQSIRRLRALLKQTETPPESLTQLGHEVAKNLQCKKSFRIRLTLEKTSPFLASILSPKLIIPKPALSEERPTDTLGILAHEIAHLKSNDLFWTALSKWVTVLYWFHPLAWKLPAAYSSACEQICDSTAAAYVGNPDAYSQTLARSALALMDLAPNQGLPMIRSSEISKRLANLKRGKVWGALSRRWVVLSIILGFIGIGLMGSMAFVEARGREKEPEPRTNPKVARKISGIITDSKGDPLNEVMVQIRRRDKSSGLTGGKNVTTDSEGIYSAELDGDWPIRLCAVREEPIPGQKANLIQTLYKDYRDSESTSKSAPGAGPTAPVIPSDRPGSRGISREARSTPTTQGDISFPPLPVGTSTIIGRLVD
ncbi:MAG: M56 family metallopeptidase, partial [Candidatus Omnitrophica bacterium]|nr:M56 family metallopeptidase [Candidatus Omnitrophota bacterium]